MIRRARSHQAWLSRLLICAVLLLTLPGCGGWSGATGAVSGNGPVPAGSAFTAGASLDVLKGLPQVSGQNGASAMLEGRATVVAPVVNGSVTAYLSDGTVLGTTTTDADGAFELYIPLDEGHVWVHDAAKGVGLAVNELRVIVTVPGSASEGAGTTLMEDLPWGFAHVTHVSTEVSLLRQRIPTLTLAAAEHAVKAHHVIPGRIDLEDVGGAYTPFSDATFTHDALAFNAAGGRAGSANEDAYLRSQIDAMAAALASGAKVNAMPRTQKLAWATGDSTDGSGRSLNDDKTDPEGSLDPSQQNAPGKGEAFTPSPTVNALDLNAYMNKLTLSNAIITSVTCTVAQLADFYILVDAANGNNAQSKWTKVLAWVGFGSVVVGGIAQIVIAILNFQANDPYLNALQQVSQQINDGFARLSQQLQATQDYLDWRISQNSYATTLSDIQAQLTLIASRQAAPTNGMVTFATAQANAAAINGTPKGLTFATRMSNLFNGSGGSPNTVLQGNRAYTAQLSYAPAAKQIGQAKADAIAYPLRSNSMTLALRPLVMQFANALDYAEQIDAYESKAALSQFSNPMTSLTSLGDRLVGSTPSFGTNGVMALRRRGLQQAPPRFASDKLWVEPGQQLAWSAEAVAIPADDKNVRTTSSTFYGNTTYSYVIDGGSFKPTAYRLNGEIAGFWRLPTIDELRRLPGWGKGGSTCVDRIKAEMGITVGGWWFATYDPTAPASIRSESIGYRVTASATVGGQVRFWDSSRNVELNGLDVAGYGSPDTKVISCLRVFDARNLALALGEGAVATFPVGDHATVAPGGARIWRSSALRAAGIAPDDIVVLDRVVDNPWYASTPTMSFMAARKVHALSALAIWNVNPVGGRPAVIIDDVSGVVEWQSSNTTVARVDNSFNRVEKVFDDAANRGQFVSPWYATLTFSTPGSVTVKANWTQGVTSADPRNTTTISETTSTDLCIPPVVTSIGVTPANMLSTLPSDLHGKTMSAYAALSDNSGLDVTGRSQWSLLEVLLDGSGNETGTTPLNVAVGTISQNGGGQTGGVLSITGGSGTTKRIRVVATDPVSGKSGHADFQLQFP